METNTNKIISMLKELGHVNSKREELREYCREKFQQIVQFLPRRLINSDGADLLDCMLNGLPDIPSGPSNKVKIVDIVLTTMRKESTSLTHCGDVISRLCLELPRLPVTDLVRWSNDSVQSIVDDTDVNMIWRDILPECTSVLVSSCDSIKYCDTEMTSSEYKEQCVHKICEAKWKEKHLVQLAAMFKDMQLSRSSHKQVVDKICSYIIDIPPDTLPPLVHQLLRLCKMYNLDVVLAHLSHYFSTRLYSKLEPPPQDSESTTMDIDDIVAHSPVELSRCLSTCIYHITQGAVEPDLVRKHIKLWPKTQLLRAPFVMDLALAISDKGRDFRTACLDVIRSAIELRSMDELKIKESAMVRSVIPPGVDVASLLKVLTTESGNHRQLTVMGLINLAFSLLAVPRTKPAAQACWSHGKLILVRLSKSQPETAGHILSLLADRLATDAIQKQYADCLYILCKLTPVSVERRTELSTILENCQPTAAEYKPAAAVLDAVHPLLNFSTRTRDVLVMVCRKGLYSRDSHHRCLALSGFLTVLRHMKLSRGAWSSSQNSSEHYSAHSYLTQLTVDLHATHQGNAVTSRVRNEAMCMEVVSILRRCLVQDATVKQLLYTSIFDCAAEKPALHESILELLYEHLNKFLSEGDGTLQLDKCVQITGCTAVLTEPIPHLLYAVAQFLQSVEDEDVEDILASQAVETGSAHLRNKLNSVMGKLCQHELSVDMEDPGITDLTPESKAKYIKVQQILQCYESLVAYRVMQWGVSSDNAAQAVYKLFKACNLMIEQTKTPPKISKKASKLLGASQKSQSQKTQKDKGKPAVKVSNIVKDRAGPLKPLPCVWDLRFCVRMVELLYSEEVPWSSTEQRNQLIGRRDFHHWALKCLHSVLSGPVEKRSVATHVLAVATVLYHRSICRFQAMREFDDQTALGCLELFKTCLSLLFSSSYSLKMDSFLPALTGLPDTAPSQCIAKILEHLHTALVQTEAEDDDDDRDVTDRKTHAAILATAAALLELPTETCNHISSVTAKLEDYVRGSKQDCCALLGPLLSAGGREHGDAPFLDELLLKLTAALGRIDEEDTSAGGESTDFPWLDARTGHAVLGYVCAHLTTRFRCAEHLVQRARDLAAAGGAAVGAHAQRIDRELKELYKSLVVELCQLTTWTGRCLKLRCCIGGGSDKVLAACVRLYALLASLTRQLDVATSHAIRFERLLKLSGKKLSSITDNLISYLEASQTQQNATKVLRDTKLIPKLVHEAENYSKHVIILSRKAKLNWEQYLSLGTARDFRIKGQVLEEVLNTRERADETRHEGDQEDINDAITEIISPAQSDQEDNERSQPDTKRKRRKVS